MSSSTLSLIVAIANNGTIGINNSLPWHLPDDLGFFKQNTVGKPIIMGRKTYESLGRPLPKRPNIVISSQSAPENLPENVHYFTNLMTAIETFNNSPEIMIIGGAQLYRAAIPMMNRLYVTRVDADIVGDTQLPEILNLPFETATLVSREHHPMDEKHAHPFTFEIWDFPSQN
ncbi:dihydrofolate reductase [Wohlfahrtiimonas chitiniclastica]|uniref:dihydrofolate reductase n=1 Tax=Wohlfahrtiimonas chitiniclastica TaxID=400946 RepID=UPI000B98840A|nr:dihydrofolate reductase [Wohlfahrtiimonas chitiniclastica]OYQ74149.1 dihydrofolate reductase [Wohlfahrtiimonas chitiniclastica]